MEPQTILQVEDSDNDARLLSLAFREAGVINPVITVPNAEQAICYFAGTGNYADRERFPLPGILLIDLKLPGMGGLDLLDLLTKQFSLKGVLLVVVSAYDEIFHVNRAYALGAQTFLSKPVQVQDITNMAKAFQGHWTFAQPRQSAVTLASSND